MRTCKKSSGVVACSCIPIIPAPKTAKQKCRSPGIPGQLGQHSEISLQKKPPNLIGEYFSIFKLLSEEGDSKIISSYSYIFVPLCVCACVNAGALRDQKLLDLGV